MSQGILALPTCYKYKNDTLADWGFKHTASTTLGIKSLLN